MNRGLGFLMLSCCTSAIGCGGDISTDGKVLAVTFIVQPEYVPEDSLEDAVRGLPAVPSAVPSLQRFEWGIAKRHDNESDDVRIIALAAFDEHPLEVSRAYRKAILQARGEDLRERVITYLFRDASLGVRRTTDRCLRRLDLVHLNRETTAEELHKIEAAITQLPGNIPAIKRFEWGTRLPRDHVGPGEIHADYRIPHREGIYCLLFTFSSTRDRDECLKHPAFKEFQSLLKEYGTDRTGGYEYVARVEHIVGN